MFLVFDFGSELMWTDDREWSEVRENLTPTDTETALNHLNIMNSATVLYEDSEEEINEGLEAKYIELLERFGGEDELTQYHDIGAFSTTLAVEKDDEPVFVFYGDEERYSKSRGLFKGLTAMF